MEQFASELSEQHKKTPSADFRQQTASLKLTPSLPSAPIQDAEASNLANSPSDAQTSSSSLLPKSLFKKVISQKQAQTTQQTALGQHPLKQPRKISIAGRNPQPMHQSYANASLVNNNEQADRLSPNSEARYGWQSIIEQIGVTYPQQDLPNITI